MTVDQGGMAFSAVVLVVEDNDRIRTSEVEALRASGYRVLSASNAEDALQLLGGHGVSLLLTDIRLPGEVNGIALARRVKRSQPEVKILLAGVDVDQFSSQDLDGIADGILRKPFRIPELQERVANLIGDLGR